VHQQCLKRYDIHTREEDLNEPELSQDDTFDMDKEESEDETFQSKKKHKKKKRKTKEEKQPVENSNQQFSPLMENSSLTSIQGFKENQVMKDLLDQLQDLQKAVTPKPKFKISSAKRQLKDLLCEGSMAIKNSERNKYWRKEISRITNHNELLEFLKDITTNFNKKFAYELSNKLQE
jgi:hypothetical protein